MIVSAATSSGVKGKWTKGLPLESRLYEYSISAPEGVTTLLSDPQPLDAWRVKGCSDEPHENRALLVAVSVVSEL